MKIILLSLGICFLFGCKLNPLEEKYCGKDKFVEKLCVVNYNSSCSVCIEE